VPIRTVGVDAARSPRAELTDSIERPAVTDTRTPTKVEDDSPDDDAGSPDDTGPDEPAADTASAEPPQPDPDAEQTAADERADERADDDQVASDVAVDGPTDEPPPPDVPEAELPDGFDDEPSDDPADQFDRTGPAEAPIHDGSDRPEAHDFTPTDGVPDLVDPYDSVDTTNPWDGTTAGADDRWGQDSLTDIGVSYETMGDWNVYMDNSTGNTYTDYGDGSFEANVGGEILTGDAAASAFREFTDTRLLTDEKLERLQQTAYDDAPSSGTPSGAAGGAPSGPPGTGVGGDDAGSDDEPMGPPSSLAGGGDDDEIADFNGDGEITLTDKVVDIVGNLFKGPAREQAKQIDREMGGSGKETSTRGEQEQGAREEIDRQEKEEARKREEVEQEQADKEQDQDDGGSTDVGHPGWGDGNRGGVSIFDSLKNAPGRRDPRDPGNVDPADEGYGDGGGDAPSTSSDDLKQPAGPDPEPSGGGGQQPPPDPIDYGPDHVDPIGSGPYDDPFDSQFGTVSLEHDEAQHTEPIEMADDGIPDFEGIDLDG
jgi:hypothetical protein